MRLLLTLDDLSPEENTEVVKSIYSFYPNIEIDNHSGVGLEKRMGDVDIVGVSTIIGSIASVLSLLWSVRPVQKNEIHSEISKSNISLHQEYKEEIVRVYKENGGTIRIRSTSSTTYNLRIFKDGEKLSIFGEIE